MKLAIVLVKLFVLGALFIISNQNLHLLVSEERGVFFDSYSEWIGSLFNQAVDVTGYVVKFEWLPKEMNNAAG
jgi:hypothetical protein